MTTTTPSAALIPVAPVFTNTEQRILNGMLPNLPFIRVKARCARCRRHPAGLALAEETARARAGSQAEECTGSLG